MALVRTVNREKHIFQLTIKPHLIQNSGLASYVDELKAHGQEAVRLKESGEIKRCVIVVHGNSGKALAGVSPSEAIQAFARELSGSESMMQVVDSIIVASPDAATQILLRFINTIPGSEELQKKIRILN